MMTVSIIVPAYNAARTIERCVASVRAQTFTGWELIIVDDGSTDATPGLLRALSVDSRVRVFRKANGGVSSARNLGLAEARGEYVAFIDADDTVEPEYLATLLLGRGRDISVVGFRYGTEPGPVAGGGDFATRGETAARLAAFINADHFCFPWARLFRRDIIERHGLRFDESLWFAEDNVFNWQYLCHTDSLRIDTAAPLYHKLDDEPHAPYRLTCEQMRSLDTTLSALLARMEAHFCQPLAVDAVKLFHAAFLRDKTERPASAFAAFFLDCHPRATRREALDHVVRDVLRLALLEAAGQATRAARVTALRRVAAFLDCPAELFLATRARTRLLIPLVKLRLWGPALALLRRMA